MRLYCNPHTAMRAKVNWLGQAWRRGQRVATRRTAKDKAVAWLLRYGQTRPDSTLAYVSAIRFEKDWLAAQAMQVNS